MISSSPNERHHRSGPSRVGPIDARDGHRAAFTSSHPSQFGHGRGSGGVQMPLCKHRARRSGRRGSVKITVAGLVKVSMSAVSTDGRNHGSRTSCAPCNVHVLKDDLRLLTVVSQVFTVVTSSVNVNAGIVTGIAQPVTGTMRVTTERILTATDLATTVREQAHTQVSHSTGG